MPKWKKDETDFTVSVCRDNRDSYVCRLPKPLVQKMGLEKRIRFRVLPTRVEVSKP